MNVNYYFLWNYNKFPFVYSIMGENENNVLIINLQDTDDLSEKLLKLDGLDKIKKVVLYKNNFSEYVSNILYRIFVYPFKRQQETITFYLDGFVGRYPVAIANIGVPNKVIFYEEGESIYHKEVLLAENNAPGFKQWLNDKIKKLLFIRKNSIYNVDKFYVRDKKRLSYILDLTHREDLNFELLEINDVERIRQLPEHDKNILKEIFFSDFTCDFFLNDQHAKTAIILTQPTYLVGIHTKDEAISLFNSKIIRLQQENYKVFLKLHPKEKDDIYLKDGVQRLNGQFPFELLALYNIVFDKGVSYNSTAINSSLIKEKYFIKDE